MTEYVLAVEHLTGTVALAGLQVPADSAGRRYLETANIEAYDGRGTATWTEDPAEAIRFASQAAAIEFWRRQSSVRPLRDDGQPNRPLTAFTVSVEPIEEACTHFDIRYDEDGSILCNECGAPVPEGKVT
jgi:hypothetical protein